MRADRDKWNNKYRNAEVRIAGEPELVDHVDLLPGAGSAHGLALELASGKGANALYLASLGYRVVAVDGSIEGLRVCDRMARDRGLAVSPVVVDLDNAALPEAVFSVISVVRYLNRTLFEAIRNALAPGGVLFYKTFNQRHLKSSPGFNPEFLLKDGELEKAFTGLKLLRESEEGESSWILASKAMS